jgi:hypothetical protein
MGFRCDFPPVPGPWTVPKGGSIQLFDRATNGEPGIELTVDPYITELDAEVRFTDDSGVPRSVTATASIDGRGSTRGP